MTPKQRIKSVSPVARAILPDTATPIERALLSVELAAIAEIDVSLISKIWNPWEIPSILLPWLAWALSVDVWDDSWSESVKRRVIAASPIVHRLKGTRAAVEAALSSMGYESTIKEWWEQEPVARRGTFEVDVIFSSVFDYLFDEKNELARKSIVASKPKSRVFEIRKILTSKTSVYLGVISSFGGRYTASLPFESPAIHENEIFVGVAALFGGTHKAGMESP